MPKRKHTTRIIVHLQVNVKWKASPTKPKSAGFSGWHKKNDIYPVLQFAMQKSKPVRLHTHYALYFFCLSAMMGFANSWNTQVYADGNVGDLCCRTDVTAGLRGLLSVTLCCADGRGTSPLNVLTFTDEAQTALFKDPSVPRCKHFSSPL